jgi:hypothetical protein
VAFRTRAYYNIGMSNPHLSIRPTDAILRAIHAARQPGETLGAAARRLLAAATGVAPSHSPRRGRKQDAVKQLLVRQRVMAMIRGRTDTFTGKAITQALEHERIKAIQLWAMAKGAVGYGPMLAWKIDRAPVKVYMSEVYKALHQLCTSGLLVRVLAEGPVLGKGRRKVMGFRLSLASLINSEIHQSPGSLPSILPSPIGKSI